MLCEVYVCYVGERRGESKEEWGRWVGVGGCGWE